MKKFKLIVPSFIALVFCMLLIAGSTFALFTSKAEASISATSGKVQIDAELNSLQLLSADATISSSQYGLAGVIGDDEVEELAELDNYRGTYYFAAQEEHFANGGTATLSNDKGTLVLERMTPGDKVLLKLDSTNTSNVDIQVRLLVSVSHANDADDALLSSLVFRLGDKEYVGLKSYTSAWKKYSALAATDDFNLEIELPLLTGNVAQSENPELPRTVSFAFVLQAVQGNAATSGAETIICTEVEVQNYATIQQQVTISDSDLSDKINNAEAVEISKKDEKTNFEVTASIPATIMEEMQTTDGSDNDVQLHLTDITVTKDIVAEESTLSFNATLKVNNEVVSSSDKTVLVTIQMEPNLGIQRILHTKSDNTVENITDFTYNPATGELSFETKSFSPFEVFYKKANVYDYVSEIQADLESEDLVENEKIVYRDNHSLAYSFTIVKENNVFKLKDQYNNIIPFDRLEKGKSKFDGGYGIKESPYLINDVDDLKNVSLFSSEMFNEKEYHFALINDISYNQGTDLAGKPITRHLCGSFDGNNHTLSISNVSDNIITYYPWNDVLIKNLKVLFTDGKFDALVYGYCECYNLTFENVVFGNENTTDTLEVSGNNSGLFMNFPTGDNTFINCVNNYNLINRKSGSYNGIFVGGYIAGNPTLTKFIRCVNNGNFQSAYVGLFFGNPQGCNATNVQVVDCQNNGTITGLLGAHALGSVNAPSEAAASVITSESLKGTGSITKLDNGSLSIAKDENSHLVITEQGSETVAQYTVVYNGWANWYYQGNKGGTTFLVIKKTFNANEFTNGQLVTDLYQYRLFDVDSFINEGNSIEGLDWIEDVKFSYAFDQTTKTIVIQFKPVSQDEPLQIDSYRIYDLSLVQVDALDANSNVIASALLS